MSTPFALKSLLASLAVLGAGVPRHIATMPPPRQLYAGDGAHYYQPPKVTNKFTPHQGAQECERRRARGW